MTPTLSSIFKRGISGEGSSFNLEVEGRFGESSRAVFMGLSHELILTRHYLIRFKAEAVRSGKAWFKALNVFERALIDATIAAKGKVRNARLTRALIGVIAKVRGVLKPLTVKALEIGRLLAERLAKLALSLGHADAMLWAEDEAFMRFLGISWINTPHICRLSQFI
ncbi:MAG: hypothetical protein QXK12_07095 [Candidatus Nezhaarchaeales archaeon]